MSFFEIMGIVFTGLLLIAFAYIFLIESPFKRLRRLNHKYIIRMNMDEFVDYAAYRDEKLRKEKKENGSKEG